MNSNSVKSPSGGGEFVVMVVIWGIFVVPMFALMAIQKGCQFLESKISQNRVVHQAPLPPEFRRMRTSTICRRDEIEGYMMKVEGKWVCSVCSENIREKKDEDSWR